MIESFGIEPAARQFKQEFIPIAKERYMRACPSDSLSLAPIVELIELPRGPELRALVGPVPGYELDAPGTVVEVAGIIP